MREDVGSARVEFIVMPATGHPRGVNVNGTCRAATRAWFAIITCRPGLDTDPPHFGRANPARERVVVSPRRRPSFDVIVGPGRAVDGALAIQPVADAAAAVVRYGGAELGAAEEQRERPAALLWSRNTVMGNDVRLRSLG